jgi:hypothetical protein
MTQLYDVANQIKLPSKRNPIIAQLDAASASLNALFANLNEFVTVSNPTQVLFKTLMCTIPSGISPFFRTTPGPAWFGWLHDPLLEEVQKLLDGLYAQKGLFVPWSSAVPGAATNWTTIEDTRRRKTTDVYKTGKKNKQQVGQYVTYQNMKELRTCVESYVAADPYDKATEFPACPFYDPSWDDETAKNKGYGIPWANDYANRIAGNDAQMFGRPVKSDKIQAYISDIYRSAFLYHESNENWYNVPVKRFTLQDKDLMNAVDNPANAQYYAFGPSGMLNTTAAAGVPVFVSYPHFYRGDPSLIQAVKGMSPNKDAHEIFLDIEPQTGLLARGRKRLQVNYQMKTYILPQIMDNSSEVAYLNCLQINETIQAINENVPDAAGIPTLPSLDCGNAFVQGMLTCLSLPSTWKMANDEIFFPFGWTSEELDLPESDANDIHDMMITTEQLGEHIQFWCLIIAGICFAILLTMLVHNYIMFRERNYSYDLYRNYKYKHQPLNTGGAGLSEPLGFTYNPENRGSNLITDDSTRLSQPVSTQPGKNADSYSFTS